MFCVVSYVPSLVPICSMLPVVTPFCIYANITQGNFDLYDRDQCIWMKCTTAITLLLATLLRQEGLRCSGQCSLAGASASSRPGSR